MNLALPDTTTCSEFCRRLPFRFAEWFADWFAEWFAAWRTSQATLKRASLAMMQVLFDSSERL
jgi:hypothetical protein